jgi:hypothetical protein
LGNTNGTENYGIVVIIKSGLMGIGFDAVD